MTKNEPLTIGYKTLSKCSKCDYDQFENCFGNARGCNVFHEIIEKLANYERKEEEYTNVESTGWEIGGKRANEHYCTVCGYVPRKNKMWEDEDCAFKFCPNCGRRMMYCHIQ